MGAAVVVEPDSTAFAAPVGVRRIVVGGRPLLYSAAGQQLFELNETADLIWRAVQSGLPESEISDALAQAGVGRPAAELFVAQALRQWLDAGLLLPTPIAAALAAPPQAVRHLTLDELSAELAFHGAADPQDCDAVFGHLYGQPGGQPVRLAVARCDDRAFLVRDGALVATMPEDGLIPAIKAELTQLYADGVEGAFLAHGALLTRNGASLFATGPPGAGKTTLTLALAAAGWAYGGDDIVRFTPDGRASGAPFAAAVKTGAWPILEPRWPELAQLATWRRADGQATRYLRPPRLAGREPRPLTAVVLLDRRDGAGAELQPLAPVEALSAILDAAYASRWRLDPDALEALATRIEAASCRRFVYSDLDAAVAALEGLADG